MPEVDGAHALVLEGPQPEDSLGGDLPSWGLSLSAADRREPVVAAGGGPMGVGVLTGSLGRRASTL